ncbi:MAG: hypothetical protein FWF75_10500, partial [Propionibacteriaceae bacterium]|nr:hypothetical protein [Propionibacteriaceae bacterium]
VAPTVPSAPVTTAPSVPVTTAPSVPVTTAPSAPDTAAPSAPVFTAPAPGSTVTTTMPRYAGTGEPGASVRVYTQTSPACAPGKMCSMLIRQLDLCSATVQRNGTWSCTSTQALSTGSAVVFAIQTDAAQNSSAPATDMFTVATRQAYCPVTNPFGPGWRRAPGC